MHDIPAASRRWPPLENGPGGEGAHHHSTLTDLVTILLADGIDMAVAAFRFQIKPCSVISIDSHVETAITKSTSTPTAVAPHVAQPL